MAEVCQLYGFSARKSIQICRKRRFKDYPNIRQSAVVAWGKYPILVNASLEALPTSSQKQFERYGNFLLDCF
jgi:hypothetical protein